MKARIADITKFREGETDVEVTRTYFSRSGGHLFLNFLFEDEEGREWVFRTGAGELHKAF